MRRFLACGLVLFLAAGCPEKKRKKADAPLCETGATMACYGGAPGTLGIGTCSAGISTCTADAEWGPCVGDIGPGEEICANGIDEDCSGVSDDGPPDLSAFEFPGNSIDDNCDGTVDEAAATCDGGLASNSANPLDHAKALDLCATTTTGATAGFGVLGASFTLASGDGSPAIGQRAIRSAFGSSLVPRSGLALSVFSTGAAASTGQTLPAAVAVEPGADHSAGSPFPADWLAANGGLVPVVSGCPAVTGSAHDPVMLTLELKVPSNANAIAFDAFYFTADYPEYVCTDFTDLFVALLDSTFAGTPANPADKNLARSSSGAAISGSCSVGGDCPFAACMNGATGCGGSVAGSHNGCSRTTSLQGTGYEVVDSNLVCTVGDLLGGGTGWFTAAGNVVPGETITVRFAIWDTTDGGFDSTVLLDNVRWLRDPVTPGLQ